MAIPTIEDVKANLIIDDSTDDIFLGTLINAAVSYAEAYQHLPDGYYTEFCGECGPHNMPERTKQAVIMLVTHWYESRDGGTGGYYGDSPSVAAQSMTAINQLLILDRNWKV